MILFLAASEEVGLAASGPKKKDGERRGGRGGRTRLPANGLSVRLEKEGSKEGKRGPSKLMQGGDNFNSVENLQKLPCPLS